MDIDGAEENAFMSTWDSCKALGSVFSKEHPPRDDPAWQGVGPPTALCTCEYPCDSIFAVPRARAGTSGGKDISKTFRELKDSAENGCVFCKYIYEEFGIGARSQTGLVDVVKIDFAHSFGHWRFLFRFGDRMQIRKLHHYEEIYPEWLLGQNATDLAAKEKWEQDNTTWSVRERAITAAARLYGEELGSINLLPEHPEMREEMMKQMLIQITRVSQFYLAREWFNRCIHQHEHCENGRDDQFYPRRMIDVRGATPRLVLLGDQDERPSGSYATLSHRWRSSDGYFNLTAENLAKFQSGIPYEQMSATFRDAIDVCHVLGVPYLWIDSMCIIQSGEGSKEDWQENGSAMSHIYANSVVNIAAETIEAGTGGFLNPATNFADRTSTRFSISGYEFVAYPISMSGIFPRPLDNRGWIVQEMLLAPRLLRFGLGQMSWECTQNPLACEAFPAGMKRDISNMTNRESFMTPNGRDHNRLRKLREEILRLELANDDPAGEKLDHSLLQRLWQDVVEAYSICDLTFFDKDKLMAVAGIASRVGRLMGSDYIAGSFRDMLPRGLLWKVEQPGSFSKDATQKILIPPGSPDYRAPTWSWASLDKGIDFAECCEYMKYPLLTELIDTVVVRVHEQNQYGPIRQADLIVRGSILKLGWADSHPEYILDSGNIKHEYVLDENTPPLSSQLFFLAIQRNKFETSEIYGLLLEKIDGDQESILSARRLGFMKLKGVPEREFKESFVIRLV